MEIKAQDTSYKDEDADESDSSSNKQTPSVEDDEFEFKTEGKGDIFYCPNFSHFLNLTL